MFEFSSGTFDLNTAATFSIQENLESSAFLTANDGLQANKYEGLEEAEQIEKIASFLNEMDEIKYENWEKLSCNERLEVLQEIENKAATVSGRVPLQVVAVDMGNLNSPLFTYGEMKWGNRSILINKHLLEQDNMKALGDCTDTILHEGRHAYQWSNLFVKRTEPSDEKYKAWAMNLQTGYLTCDRFGFQRYSMQPVELDARVFAEGIRSKISYR